MKSGYILLLSQSSQIETQLLEHFQPIKQLVDHCWQAGFPDGQKVDNHCFSTVYGGVLRMNMWSVVLMSLIMVKRGTRWIT